VNTLTLTFEQTRDAVDGLFAYDSGAVDSGIHDEALRVRVVQRLRDLPPPERRDWCGRIVIDLFLGDDAARQGYGEEDAAELLGWFDVQGIEL